MQYLTGIAVGVFTSALWLFSVPAMSAPGVTDGVTDALSEKIRQAPGADLGLSFSSEERNEKPEASQDKKEKQKETEKEKGWWQEIKEVLFGAPEPPPPPPKEEISRPKDAVFSVKPEVAFAAATDDVKETSKVLSVTVLRRANTEREVAVTIEAGGEGDTAREGVNYRFPRQTLRFGRGETEKSLQIPILDDGQFNDPERKRFTLTIISAENAGINASGRILSIDIIDDHERIPPTPPAVVSGSSAGFPIARVRNGKALAPSSATVTFRNNGGLPATIEKVVVQGPGLSLAEEKCSAAPLLPQATCSVKITFSPTSVGTIKGSLLATWRSATVLGGMGELNSLDFALTASAVAAPEPRDPLLDEIAKAKAERSQADVMASSYLKEPRPAATKEWRMSQEDYPAESKGMFTFPVDLTRVIPTTRMIPCVLMDTINSQIPGSARCIVESPVFGQHGRLVLVSPGTVFEGTFNSLAKDGDTRLNILWTRGMRPDGSSFRITSGLEGHDAMGRTGAPGNVDSRLWAKYGQAALLTTLNVAVAAATPAVKDGASPGSGQRAQSELSRNLGVVTADQLAKKLDLPPIITVAEGTRLEIKPTVDLWFPIPEELKEVSDKEKPQNAKSHGG